MQEQAKIDSKLNLVLSINDDDGQETKFFIPQPTRVAFDSVAKFLRVFYTKATQKNPIPADVLVVDYALIIKEAMDDEENDMKKMQSFIDRTLLGASVFLPNGEFKPYAECTFSDDFKALVEGTLVFTCALYRYVAMSAKKTLLKDIVTSLDSTAWKTQCESSFKDAMAKEETAQA